MTWGKLAVLWGLERTIGCFGSMPPWCGSWCWSAPGRDLGSGFFSSRRWWWFSDCQVYLYYRYIKLYIYVYYSYYICYCETVFDNELFYRYYYCYCYYYYYLLPMTVVTILHRIYRTEPRRLSQLVGHDLGAMARWHQARAKTTNPIHIQIHITDNIHIIYI